MVLKMLEEAGFESRTRFEQEVRSIKGNKDAVSLEDGHTLVPETAVAALLKGESDLDCRVRLK